MKCLPLVMVRKQLDNIPDLLCPTNYQVRNLKSSEAYVWASLQTSVGQFDSENLALRRFEKQFSPYPEELESRCFVLENGQGQAIGSATAWFGYFNGKIWGRVAWFGIVPAYRGKQLAKPLLSAVLNRLAKDHQSAYLVTYTTNYQAVNLYLNYGFVPYQLLNPAVREGWQLIAHKLNRRIFDQGS